MTHDSNYKQIFSHPEMIIDLLQGFVREEWTSQIDFSTLEKVNNSYVSEELLQREDDIIWRVKTEESWLYIYLLIEFQSTNDPWMALRIMVYTGLLYQDLIKSGAVSSKELLPPVFPIVLYNGSKRWTAAQEVSELIEPYSESLKVYRPSQRYFLLDEGRVNESELKQAEGTLSEIIRLETSPAPEDIRAIVKRLSERLSEPRYNSLRRSLVVWINRALLKRMNPKENIPEVTEIKELDSMLEERVDEWASNLKQKAMEQGESAILSRLIRKRFGKIPSKIEEKITNASEAQLERWADNIFDAKNIDEIFYN